MFCQKCGTKGNYKEYCQNCGNPLDNDEKSENVDGRIDVSKTTLISDNYAQKTTDKVIEFLKSSKRKDIIVKILIVYFIFVSVAIPVQHKIVDEKYAASQMQKAEGFYKEAVSAYEQGDYTEAEILISDALSIDSDNEEYISFSKQVKPKAKEQKIEDYISAAIIKRDEGNYIESYAIIIEALELDRNNAELDALRKEIVPLANEQQAEKDRIAAEQAAAEQAAAEQAAAEQAAAEQAAAEQAAAEQAAAEQAVTNKSIDGDYNVQSASKQQDDGIITLNGFTVMSHSVSDGAIVGVIRNDTGVYAEDVYIDAEFYDANGIKLVETATAFVENLAPDAQAHFKFDFDDIPNDAVLYNIFDIDIF